MNMAAKPDTSPKAQVTPSEGSTGATRSTVLSEADIVLLRDGLGKGMSGYARQGDILELYNRLAEQLDKLPASAETGTDDKERAREAEQIAALRRELRERLKGVETSLAGLEGALRIELAPFLEKAVREATQTGQPQRRRGWKTGMTVLLALAAGVVLGAVYCESILSIASLAQARLGF